MVYGRRAKLTFKLKLPSNRKNWTSIIILTDQSKLLYGKRGASYYMLCHCGLGRGFAYEADMIKAINSHNHQGVS